MLSLKEFSDEVTVFLARPLGGVELEGFLALMEIVYGLVGWPFWNWPIPHLYFAVRFGFIVSGLLTYFGLYLFTRHNTLCAPVRWIAAILSIILWSVNAVTTHPVFIINSLAAVRIMVSAYRRPWPKYG